MDDKVHEVIMVHEREEGDGDSMWQPRCNIVDEESHPTCSNKAHWCATSLYSRISWKWQSYIRISFNGGHGDKCAHQSITKKTT
jgi:hypothetical protein